eukprot:UN04585
MRVSFLSLTFAIAGGGPEGGCFYFGFLGTALFSRKIR